LSLDLALIFYLLFFPHSNKENPDGNGNGNGGEIYHLCFRKACVAFGGYLGLILLSCVLVVLAQQLCIGIFHDEHCTIGLGYIYYDGLNSRLSNLNFMLMFPIHTFSLGSL